jgi:hypothetical protein
MRAVMACLRGVMPSFGRLWTKAAPPGTGNVRERLCLSANLSSKFQHRKQFSKIFLYALLSWDYSISGHINSPIQLAPNISAVRESAR